MKIYIFIALFSTGANCLGQNRVTKEYYQFIQRADSFYFLKDYKNSHINYSLAFFSNNDIAYVKDRYNSACSWSLDNNMDSAFYQLFRIAKKGNFNKYQQIINDIELISLHKDERWDSLLNIIKSNK
jgi:hypothetical protein